MKVEKPVQLLQSNTNSALTTGEKCSSMLRGAKNMLKDLIFDNNELSWKKIGSLALTASLFAVGNRAAVASGYVKASTVSKMLTGLGLGWGGYTAYGGLSNLNKAENKYEKLKAWEQIGAGAGTAAISIIPAKMLSKGLKKVQPANSPTTRPQISEVVSKSLDNEYFLNTLKDKHSIPLYIYGALFESVNFSKPEEEVKFA